MEIQPKNEVLLLTDQAGSYYAIPVEHLQTYRVLEEYREEIDKFLSNVPEVQGYGLLPGARLANIMWDPPEIFGGPDHKGGINDPSLDSSTIVQVEQTAFAMVTFLGRILNLASLPASGRNTLKNLK